jgi:hypothetical protein
MSFTSFFYIPSSRYTTTVFVSSNGSAHIKGVGRYHGKRPVVTPLTTTSFPQPSQPIVAGTLPRRGIFSV